MDSSLQIGQTYFNNVKIYSNNVLVFRNICVLYKSILDKNYGERFCIGSHCKTIFMIEVKVGNGNNSWGGGPKIFYSKQEAEKQIEALKLKYPFVSEFRIVTRKISEEKEED